MSRCCGSLGEEKDNARYKKEEGKSGYITYDFYFPKKETPEAVWIRPVFNATFKDGTRTDLWYGEDISYYGNYLSLRSQFNVFRLTCCSIMHKGSEEAPHCLFCNLFITPRKYKIPDGKLTYRTKFLCFRGADKARSASGRLHRRKPTYFGGVRDEG